MNIYVLIDTRYVAAASIVDVYGRREAASERMADFSAEAQRHLLIKDFRVADAE